MAISFQILPEHGLIYIRYSGTMGIAESGAAFETCIGHPDFRKGMKQLIDLSAITDWERDFAAIMQHQAREAEVYDNPLHPVLMVCLAPSELARTVARLVNRAWCSTDRVVSLIVDTEREALTILGIDRPSIRALLHEV